MRLLGIWFAIFFLFASSALASQFNTEVLFEFEKLKMMLKESPELQERYNIDLIDADIDRLELSDSPHQLWMMEEPRALHRSDLLSGIARRSDSLFYPITLDGDIVIMILVEPKIDGFGYHYLYGFPELAQRINEAKRTFRLEKRKISHKIIASISTRELFLETDRNTLISINVSRKLDRLKEERISAVADRIKLLTNN